MEVRTLTITAFFILTSLGLTSQNSSGPHASAQVSAAATCHPILPPPCKEGASPGVIQIVPDGTANKFKLARKRFYVSSCPFDLSANVNVATAPTLRSFYDGIGASPQLVSWLEENHCQTIYCRPLTINDVTCAGTDTRKCVPEFNAAYGKALSDLKGDAELALRMITNYAPLADARLRVGFYEARAQWLKTVVTGIERAVGNDYRLRTTITDKDGVGFFYDLCPGTYYLSSVAPIDVDGVEILWETAKPIKVEGPPDVKTATRATLAFPPGKDRKNYFVGRPLSEFSSQK